MKKNLLLLPILLLCSCQEKYPFAFEDKYYNNASLIELSDISHFNELEDNNESFGIYLYLPGCLTCQSFKPILNEFIELNNITLYSISYTKIKDTRNTLYSNIEYAPSVVLFNEGKLVTYLDALNNDHIPYYESIEGFSEWFNTYVEIK